jgi:dephospho-CoA kinase
MNPLVVGLTGGLATGKTTVGEMFRKLGAEVVDCDRIAHRALGKGTPAYRKIVKRWRDRSILNRGGAIDRKKLGQIVFRSRRERRKLEGFIHPFVRREIRARIAKARKRIVVLEVPLLFETHFDQEVDFVVAVTASRGDEIRRARERLGLSAAQARKRIASQMPLGLKARRSDAVIANDGTRAATRRAVSELWNHLKLWKRRSEYKK